MASRLQSLVKDLGPAYQTQAPVTRCLVLPLSRRLNIRTIFGSLLSRQIPVDCGVVFQVTLCALSLATHDPVGNHENPWPETMDFHGFGEPATGATGLRA